MLPNAKNIILFVDDDVESLRLYKRKFNSIYQVRTAENGHDALEILHSAKVDAVISDLRMPEMDGLELLEKVKAFDSCILRVIITAYDDYERIVEGLNSGSINNSFKKPLNDKYLKLVLDEFLENKRIKIKNKEIVDTAKMYSKELSDKLKERTDELKEAYRLLDESDRRYKYAIKAAKQGILDWGISDDQLVLNDVFLENLGYERSDIIMRNLEDLKNYIHPDQRDAFFTALKEHMKSGNRMEMRVQLMGKYGKYVWLNFIGLVVEWDRKNRPIRFIGACIDITSQLNLEKELVRANDELKLINETKRNFIANVSHELRTPMNSILGFASLYEESSEEATRARYVQYIKTAANGLNKVLDDMLAFSALSDDMIPSEMNNFKLDGFLHTVGKEIHEKVLRKNLEFSMKIDQDIPFYLIGHEALLKKTIMAVLDNAVKFTSKGEIELSVNKLEQDQDELTLEFIVTDTGIGIDEADREGLFKAFNQGDASSTRAYDGLGLGLSIALKDMKTMGGTLEIESEKHQGTKVSMRLPFRAASEVKRLEMKLLDMEKFPVVLYDRHVDIVDKFQQMLINLGFSVIRVSDLTTLKKTLKARSGVQFIIACQKALDDIRPYVAVKRHIVIGIDNFSSDYVEGWVHGIVKKPVIASELYNVLVASLVKHHPQIAEKEMTFKVPVQTIERIEDMHVLVVEDSAMNRKIMENILKPVHVQVTFAEDGPSTLALEAMDQYNIVFMDINLPGMNGDEVCRQLRLRKELSTLAIIGLTAEMDKESIEAYKKVGMNDVLMKPYNVEQIYRTIEKYASMALPEIGEKVQIESTTDPMFAVLENIGVDVSSALRRLNGSVEMYLDLLEKFSDAYSQWSATSLYDKGQTSELKHTYHTLKGLAGNLGATEIQQIANELEKQAAKDMTRILEVDMQTMDRAIQDFLEAVHVLLQINKDEAVSETRADNLYNASEIDDILMTLSHLIEDYDTVAVDQLRTLDYQKFPDAISEQLKKANEAVQNFDFDEALTRIKLIQDDLKR